MSKKPRPVDLVGHALIKLKRVSDPPASSGAIT